jgi:hypothetical protein
MRCCGHALHLPAARMAAGLLHYPIEGQMGKLLVGVRVAAL